jgi:hypothetical protein
MRYLSLEGAEMVMIRLSLIGASAQGRLQIHSFTFTAFSPPVSVMSALSES